MRNKQFLLIIILSMFKVLLFSEETSIYYRVLRNTPYFTTGYSKEMTNETADGFLILGDKVQLAESPYSYSGSFGFLYVNNIDQGVGRFYLEDLEMYLIANDLMPWDAEVLFAQNILTKLEGPDSRYYLMDYTAAVLKSQNRNMLLEYEPFWKNPENPLLVDEFFDLTPWYQVYASGLDTGYPVFSLTNIFFTFFGTEFAIKNIQIIDNGYRITAKFMTDNWEYGYPIPFDFTPVENDVFFDILLQFDGDYLDVILAKNNKKLATAIAVNKEFIDQYRYLIAYNTCDLSNITWPRHADGSSDFDDKIVLRQKVDSVYRTTDNLRLRSAEDTTSDILTTLEKGTRVIVKELGKQQTIDGITANWVQVKLEDGTEGWCFGGYLVEVPVEMKVPSPAHTEEVKDTTPAENDEKDIPDETGGDITTSPFPLLPVAGGAVLVIVIALVVVIAKRRKR